MPVRDPRCVGKVCNHLLECLSGISGGVEKGREGEKEVCEKTPEIPRNPEKSRESPLLSGLVGTRAGASCPIPPLKTRLGPLTVTSFSFLVLGWVVAKNPAFLGGASQAMVGTAGVFARNLEGSGVLPHPTPHYSIFTGLGFRVR